MTGGEFKRLRMALSAAVGRHLSQADIGAAFGLAASSADRTVRNWETGEPSGPAAVAMTYLAQGALDDAMREVIPEFVHAGALPDGDTHPELVIRLWWPRFVAVVLSAEVPPPEGARWVWIERGVERLVAALWIDDPAALGSADPDGLLQRAAVLLQEATLDAIE